MIFTLRDLKLAAQPVMVEEKPEVTLLTQVVDQLSRMTDLISATKKLADHTPRAFPS